MTPALAPILAVLVAVATLTLILVRPRLLAGLTIVVEGLVRSGVTDPATEALAALAGPGAGGQTGAVVLALGTAALSNVVNSLPMALIVAAAFRQVDPELAQRLVAGAIVVIDLGPNLTTVGSFATMRWLMLLRRRGLDVSARTYARVGFIVTPPALLAATLALWLTG